MYVADGLDTAAHFRNHIFPDFGIWRMGCRIVVVEVHPEVSRRDDLPLRVVERPREGLFVASPDRRSDRGRWGFRVAFTPQFEVGDEPLQFASHESRGDGPLPSGAYAFKVKSDASVQDTADDHTEKAEKSGSHADILWRRRLDGAGFRSGYRWDRRRAPAAGGSVAADDAAHNVADDTVGGMTTKERLHKLVDDLTDVEGEQALHVIASRRGHVAQASLPSSIVLDETQAQRFLDALDAQAGFEPGRACGAWSTGRTCSAGEQVRATEPLEQHARMAALGSALPRLACVLARPTSAIEASRAGTRFPGGDGRRASARPVF
ncbi:hypothetical protein Q5424_04850 [Conexibacter sp. JD483]|uniref:hypothetical protein n=1 Tax=unclassified Conexibacter TaxID=2627773 RepID=UPI002728F105|nr:MULTISPECIES: hypothetical protein [unclassified Conexibacter]MDO8184661.1 hypothetical protein [Conexibacter sp. CPCC 205706]MDO8197967.1 hypothetical protein [Conexibacter sp. CPCC 205762]MDR9368397.1 hypothetical protein [Conexibacter sp. JD483]